MKLYLRGSAEPGAKRSPVVATVALRRMSRWQRTTCEMAIAEMDRTGTEAISAIYAATVLGCLEDTERFLQEIRQDESVLRSPLPFMRSTHNTIAGQLALLLDVKGENITFSHDTTSFHAALTAASLHLQERPQDHVLVLATDERTDLSASLIEAAMPGLEHRVGEGGGAFIVSGSPGATDVARITLVRTSVAPYELLTYVEQHAIVIAEKAAGTILHLPDVLVEPISVDEPVHGALFATMVARTLQRMQEGVIGGTYAILGEHGGRWSIILLEPC